MMKIEIQKYTEYKDSGMEWIGEIPSHWKVIRLKYIFRILKRIAGELGYNVLSITQTGIKVKDTESGEGQLSMDYSKYQIIQKGDFAMNHMDLLTGYVDISSYDGVISPDYRVFDLIDSNSDKSFMLLLLQLGYRSIIFYAHGQGVSMLGRWRFPTENFNDFLFPIPPKDEQTAIAAFLDRKTALIDQAIDIKQKQIELLKERRQILIHKAVTRGLNPNVKMKDSGVEWIGEIPEGWEVKKVKHIVKQSFSGGTPSTDKLSYWDGGIPWVSSVDIKTDYLSETTREISFLGLAKSSSKKAPKGSILFVTRSGILQHTFAITILKIEMAINQDIKCLVLTKNILPEYFQKVIKGNNSRILVEVRQQAATVESIDMEAFFNLSIPIPEIKEQNEILKFTETINNKIATAISLKEQEIEKLKEYKATLINSAVTGKIKVV
jgi:type I restriction enzyme S subunit